MNLTFNAPGPKRVLTFNVADTTQRLNKQAVKIIQLTKIRVRREAGAFVGLFRWLFISNDVDTKLSTNSMGTLKHTIKGFKDVEKQLERQNNEVSKQIQQVNDQVWEEEQKTVRALDINAVQWKLSNRKDAILHNIQRTENAYAKLSTVEFSSMRDKINKQAHGKRVPDIPWSQFQPLLKATVLQEKKIKISLAVPIVITDKFTEYFAIATSNTTTNFIADFKPHSIMINQQRQ